ncbi:MAG TPA: pepsin/retropepsin-like aspartic protease family protein [Saprospiraceae bacterium]|nr:pepsin/retropepsin-like aspartic protease family protein [Saprospiraceae bacterium]
MKQIFQPRHVICLLLVCSFMFVDKLHASVEKPINESILCNVSFPQAVAADINTVYIPFSLVGQLMVVEARVDTVSGLFIVDTGSEHLVMNKKHYDPHVGAMSVFSTGNTGVVESAVATNVDSLRIQMLVIKNLFAHIVDLSHIEVKKNTRIAGILGYDVFKKFELFIDFPERRIVLRRLDRSGIRVDQMDGREIPSDSMSFVLKNHFIQLVAVVNGVKLKMILDSGAELNLIDRHVNRKVLENFSIIKRVNLVGMGRKEIEVLAGVLRGVSCGHQHEEKMNTLLTNLDAINEGFDVQADGVLGYEFLKTRRTMINYLTRKVYFFNPVRP